MRRYFALTFVVVVGLLACLAPVASASVDRKGNGSQLGTRIVGGHDADPGEYPWQAALVRHADNGGDDFDRQFCGGSLIASDVVLTAAHCMVFSPEEFQVVLGRTTLSDDSHGERIDIAEVEVHEDYEGSSHRNDVALLKLAEPSSQPPVTRIAEDEEALWQPGDLATITGWGALSEGGPGSDDLQEATVPLLSDEDCAGAYGSDFDSAVMLCAAEANGGVDTCQGDSGGPLVVPDGNDSWRLAGITSWGVGCARQGSPGVYTRIGEPALREWITEHMAGAGGDASIDGNPLNVFAAARGNLQAGFDGSATGLFYPTGSDVGDAGFFVGMTGGDLAGEVFGPPIVAGDPSSELWRAESRSSPAGAGTSADPFTQSIVYAAVDPSTDDELLRVTQTLRYVNGESKFSADYRVENVGGQSLPFRASAAGDLYVEGSDSGWAVFEAGPPRFVGGRVDATGGAMGGLQEVGGSPWSHYQEADYSDLWSLIGSPSGAGFDDSISDDFIDNGAGVQWDGHSSSGLPAGGSVTYSVVWDARRDDGSAPNTTIRSGPAAVTRQTGATFEFSSTEPGSTFDCSLDGGQPADCESPHALSNVPPGPHTLTVRARDLAGNVDPSPTTWSWRVDNVAPNSTITAGPPALTNSTSATLRFTSSEPGSTFECRLDGAAAWTRCSSPKALSGVPAGSHTFRVRAVDTAGNADPTPATRTWRIERTPPNTRIASGPSGTVRSRSASFRFSASEAGSRFQCRFDRATAWTSCASPKGYFRLATGSHTFRVRAIDLAGNVDSTPAIRIWRIR